MDASLKWAYLISQIFNTHQTRSIWIHILSCIASCTAYMSFHFIMSLNLKIRCLTGAVEAMVRPQKGAQSTFFRWSKRLFEWFCLLTLFIAHRNELVISSPRSSLGKWGMAGSPPSQHDPNTHVPSPLVSWAEWPLLKTFPHLDLIISFYIGDSASSDRWRDSESRISSGTKISRPSKPTSESSESAESESSLKWKLCKYPFNRRSEFTSKSLKASSVDSSSISVGLCHFWQFTQRWRS
jgi:hypothetical protein